MKLKTFKIIKKGAIMLFLINLIVLSQIPIYTVWESSPEEEAGQWKQIFVMDDLIVFSILAASLLMLFLFLVVKQGTMKTLFTILLCTFSFLGCLYSLTTVGLLTQDFQVNFGIVLLAIFFPLTMALVIAESRIEKFNQVSKSNIFNKKQ